MGVFIGLMLITVFAAPFDRSFYSLWRPVWRMLNLGHAFIVEATNFHVAPAVIAGYALMGWFVGVSIQGSAVDVWW